jgi:hypothetical protein
MKISKRAITRLRLKEGDILVVKDQETANRLMAAKGAAKFPHPIVVAPDGIRRLGRKYWEKLIANPGSFEVS